MKLMRNSWLHVACRELGSSIHVMVLLAVGLVGLQSARIVHAQGMSTTTVQGTLYLANGQTSSGTLQVSWPSFTTASGQAVVAGNTTVAVGSDGFVSVNLTPNIGASPAGLYYTAVFYLSNGSTTTQYRRLDAAQLLRVFNGTVHKPAAEFIGCGFSTVDGQMESSGCG